MVTATFLIESGGPREPVLVVETLDTLPSIILLSALLDVIH